MANRPSLADELALAAAGLKMRYGDEPDVARVYDLAEQNRLHLLSAANMLTHGETTTYTQRKQRAYERQRARLRPDGGTSGAADMK